MDSRNGLEKLPEYVRRIRREKGLSTTDVERQSGGEISDAYVTRIENGYVKNVSPEKLRALAKGLQGSEDEIFAVARGKALSVSEAFESEIYVAFKGFEELSEEDKAEMLATVRMLGSEIQRRRPKKPPDKGKGKK